MKHEPKDSKQQEWPEGLFEFNQEILNQFPDIEELRDNCDSIAIINMELYVRVTNTRSIKFSSSLLEN